LSCPATTIDHKLLKAVGAYTVLCETVAAVQKVFIGLTVQFHSQYRETR